MKKIIVLFLFFGFLASFFSCSTDFDLYSDYKDVPIVYGIINVKADTNFIKITKAFCGSNDNPIDANEAALIYDSSNYPEKLNAYIIEMQSSQGQAYQATDRKFMLDTLTIHNKETGFFYAPDQTLYYTTERFKANSDTHKYRYKLLVIKPDGDTVTASTTPVGGNLTLFTSKVFFQSMTSDEVEKLFFRSSEEAVLYDISMEFYYREQHPGQPMTTKKVSWSYGSKTLSEYEKAGESIYSLDYSVNTLFNALSNAIGGDTIWDVNHPNVTRYIDDFVIVMVAAGREFYENYQMILESGNVHSNSAYSNINGGYGLFSSRVKISRTAELSSTTKRDIFGMKSWGFHEE